MATTGSTGQTGSARNKLLLQLRPLSPVPTSFGVGSPRCCKGVFIFGELFFCFLGVELDLQTWCSLIDMVWSRMFLWKRWKSMVCGYSADLHRKKEKRKKRVTWWASAGRGGGMASFREGEWGSCGWGGGDMTVTKWLEDLIGADRQGYKSTHIAISEGPPETLNTKPWN